MRLPVPRGPSGAGPLSESGSDGFSWRFTTPLYLAAALNPANTSLLVTALVPIAASVDVPVGDTFGLVMALYLTSSIAQPTAGTLAERFGPRRIVLVGSGLAIAGGLLGGLASDLALLVGARVLIGLGTSAAFPSAMLLIRRRATVLGLTQAPGAVLSGLAVFGQATMLLGLPLGGLLISAAGWRAAFLVNVPLAVLVVVLALWWLPSDPPTEEPGHPLAARPGLMSQLDVAGIVAFGAMVLSLLILLTGLPPVNWSAAALAGGAAACLALRERRAAYPFIDLRLLATNLPLLRGYGRAVLCLFAGNCVMYAVAQWLQGARGLDPAHVGLAVLPLSIATILVVRPLGRSGRTRTALVIACAGLFGGALLLAVLTPRAPLVLVMALMAVFGAAVGAASIGNQTTTYHHAPPGRTGTAFGLYRTATYIGSVAASTFTGLVVAVDPGVGGLNTIGWLLAAMTAALVLLTVADLRKAGRTIRDPGHREP
ncbi:MFS transporter [Pseudonocardia sp. CA-107938]|uniref:MFS transporter n=1 Tax=Pseudonocardia sp. CA-107938 TaxID=3240021 RepID=UPI003D90596F